MGVVGVEYAGHRRLLDGVIAYLPSPKDRPPITGYDAKDKEVEIVCDPDKPFVAVAFKITSDKHGDLYFLRIYQGTLKKGSRVLNATRGFKENITRIFEMHAASRDIREIARAGDIVAVVGLKDTLTGDTLCDSKNSVVMAKITFPQTFRAKVVAKMIRMFL